MATVKFEVWRGDADGGRSGAATLTDRSAPVQLMEWLCHRHGFGTYLHYMPGVLNRATFRESLVLQERLVRAIQERKGAIYVDTMISPSMASALAQSLQMPGVSGMDNNTILFEYGLHDPESVLEEAVQGLRMAGSTRMNRLVLRHTDHFFGGRKTIHVWLTWHDARNANLMILLTYILLGNRDWHGAEVSIFAAYPRSEARERTEALHEMIVEGRLLISEKNITVIPTDDGVDFERLVEARSNVADLVMLGFTSRRLERKGVEVFKRFPSLRDTLFVSAEEEIDIE